MIACVVLLALLLAFLYLAVWLIDQGAPELPVFLGLFIIAVGMVYAWPL